MRVLFVSSEVYPLAKSGGLADVSWALPAALARLGVDVRLLIPGYPQALDKIAGKHIQTDLGDLLGAENARLIAGRLPGADLPVWLVDVPELFRREGGLYQDADGRDWPDNAIRFAALSHAGARLGLGIPEIGWQPDIIHVNDWHTGLLPLILAASTGPRPATLLTIHNMAFQGNFPAGIMPHLGIPGQRLHPESLADGLEFHGQISFLKAGIRYSDRLATVSPTYAKEILSPEFGFGFEGLLQHRAKDLTGILNGVDYGIWDPINDLYLPRAYGPGTVSDKKISKAKLQEELRLPIVPDVPVIAFMSRLAHQKMVDIVLEALPWIAGQAVQFVLLGEGDRDVENAFREMAHAHPEKIAVRIGYEEPLAHRLLAGADILLAPSRFEPCGLTHLYAARYGTLPIVRRTGGLADTVIDSSRQTIKNQSATGFVFDDATITDMITCLQSALSLYSEPLAWRRIQLQAMKQDFGWATSAQQYLTLYQSLTAQDKTIVRESDDLIFAQSVGQVAIGGD